MKIQCRAALIALESLSGQLSLQTRSLPFAYHTITTTTTTNTTTTTTTTTMSYFSTSSSPPDEDEDDEETHENQRRPVSVRATEPLNFLTLPVINPSYASRTAVPPQDLEHRLLEDPSHRLENIHTNSADENEFLLTTITYDNKLFNELMLQEERLHQRIIRGISSYKHKYVLIEDIDIRNRIRTAVDVIFHHAVFVAAMSRSPVRLACTHASSSNRALAAMMVRLLTRLDSAFPSYCREITYTLADNIKAFLEYTGYKLLAMTQFQQQHHHPSSSLCDMVFGPACRQSLCDHALGQPVSSSSFHPLPSARQPSLLLTLHSVSACFDLMGAAFIGKILSESHVECAVQRTCELLADDHLKSVKRALLVDLLEGWLTIKRGLVAGELCRLVRLEIDKCDRQEAQHQRPSSSSIRPLPSRQSTGERLGPPPFNH
ncbi:hypothetical protein EC973_000199 [Apophysomyces ossiformis]|uniref:Uncharacterized protein n=1 Tax=Apophysomyces ossiformis TaxID=679940 RepID=A0A8H7ESG5_9FUNG|nr:hypothetical protein EC973_000199 [Apophysomyces ossiformis]